MMLELYSNIKRFRKQLNMSQQELAEAVGYKGKSMIAQVENGKVDLSASMISKFAKVFGITEMELMGWEKPQHSTSHRLPDYTISNEDSTIAIEMYDRYKSATPEARAAIELLLGFHGSGS